MLNKILIGLVVFVAVFLAVISVNSYEDHQDQKQAEVAAEQAAMEQRETRIKQLEGENQQIKQDCLAVVAAYSEIPEEDRPLAAVPSCGFTILP